MKTKTRFIVTCLVVLLTTLAMAGTVMADVVRTEFAAWDIPGSLTPGRIWMEGGYLYMRDMVGVSQVLQVMPDKDLNVTGSAPMNLNANIDLARGCGHIWGKFELNVVDNSFWNGSYTGEMCVDSNGLPQSFTTRGVAQGRGALKGFQMRYTNVNGYMTGIILETPSQ
jgi:hypothetical protein